MRRSAKRNRLHLPCSSDRRERQPGVESAGRSYREADIRRDTRDEGATQSEVLQLLNVSRRSDGYARKTAGMTPGDPPDAPQGEDKPQGKLIGRRKSAEGIVVETKRAGRRDASLKRRNRRTHSDEGLKGGRYRMVRQMVVVSNVMIFGALVRQDTTRTELHRQENPVL